MADPTSWPALQGPGGLRELPERLVYDRAVWGKVHGSAADFRWIAASPGFDPAGERLEQELVVGPEDEPPGPFPLWRALEASHLAVLCTPGRSVDAAGRKSPLAKQVLRWRRDPGVPAAAAALLLLNHAESFDDTLWLDSQAPAGGQPIPLDSEGELPVAPTPEEVEALIERGIEDLRRSVSPGGLAAFYAGLLAGLRSQVLPTAGRPLSPQALAALLLPLDPDRAAALSLAGWIPSGRARHQTLARRWDGVAAGGPVAARLQKLRAGEGPAADLLDRGHRMAEALLMAVPEALARPGDRVPRSRGPSRAAPEGDHPIHLALWGPSASGKTILLARLASSAWTDGGPWKVWPTEDLLDYSQGMRELIDRENRFPRPTGVEPERIAYRFERRTDGLRAVLSIEDRAGSQWEGFDQEALERLEAADGLLLLIDPLRDPARRHVEIRNMLDRLAVARGGGPDERPLAVCLSKADLLLEGSADLRLARDEPDHFARSRLSREILAVLDQFHADYRLFPVSAVGARLRWGVVEPAVFYDEAPGPRIHPGAEPLHLVSPFAWLLDRAAARRGGAEP